MNARFARCVYLSLATLLLPLARPAAAQTTPDGDVILYAKNATVIQGAWSPVNDATAAGSARLWNPNKGAAKITTAAAAPASYFELTFTPSAGRAYRLWIRGRAENDSYQNDSAFVQFSGSLDANGAPAFRIGTTQATWVGIEEGSGKGVSGWGWQDNGYDAVGAPIYFDGTPQTIRIQQREDGLSIDQIVLSPVTWWTSAPGAAKNDATILPLPQPANANIVLYAKNASTIAGGWSVVTDSTAAGGARMTNPNLGKAKITTPAASPSSYFELTFTPESGRAYRLWFRGRAEKDSYQNDSAFVQFSGSVNASGAPIYRIGTTEATWVGIEQGDGAGLSGWGWSDNGYDAFGPTISFDGTPQTIRVQQREDGISIDQIVLSPVQYMTDAPGAAKNDTTILPESAAAAPSSPSTTPDPTPDPPSLPAPPPPDTSTSSTIRVLQWNTHHGGYGTDGVYDPDRLATWIVKMAPDIVFLNEIEKYTGWGNQDQPEVYKHLLETKTGHPWYYVSAQEYGQWDAKGKTNLILSPVPFDFVDRYELDADRSVALASITWNGRTITLLGTHLDADSTTIRVTQANELITWGAAEPENRIVAGDMNAQASEASMTQMKLTYVDTWAAAKSAGTAVSFSGNNGETRNSRIDYIFLSKGAANLSLVSSQVFDTRDANGVMPSDHRPLLSVFTVK